jgi:hypothetical protein
MLVLNLERVERELPNQKWEKQKEIHSLKENYLFEKGQANKTFFNTLSKTNKEVD